MTDRELLKFAAKAVGIEEAIGDRLSTDCRWLFDPLNNDGDALRLAVKLHLWVGQHPDDGVTVSDFYGRSEVISEDYNKDSYADTRRAITRAAAEIGRGTK
jgi:hypothetical protein